MNELFGQPASNPNIRRFLNPVYTAQYPTVVIAVDDVEKAADDVRKAGGKVLGEPMEIPGVGQYVSFTDTEGNRVSMLQPSARGGNKNKSRKT